MVARSKNIFGPYEYAGTNPILTHRHLGKNAEINCVGHCDLTEDEQGNWFMVVLGCRPVDGKTFLGRETFLAKVEWEDDWPVVNPGVGMLEKEICLPGEKDNSMPGELNEVRNYSFKNMTDKKLPPDFMMLRNPQPNAYTIDEQEECLKLPAKAVAIGDNGSPSYVAVRQKHHRFQAETEFLLKAGEKGDRAGIAYLQNSQNYLLAEYGEVGADGYIYVTVCINGTEKILAEKKTEKRGMQTLRLSVDQSLAQVWLIRPETEEKSQCIIREVDISHMCTEAVGGFTGCTVGMYVHSEQKQSTGCAQFCRFTVK